MNERMNEWLNEWMNEWMNDWMNEWMNDWIKAWINLQSMNDSGMFCAHFTNQIGRFDKKPLCKSYGGWRA